MNNPPEDFAQRKGVPPLVCYAIENLPAVDMPAYFEARQNLEKIDEVMVPPRDARTFYVPAGHFFRISSVEGSQVGDLNIWNANNLNERFFSGKTRQQHATHVSTGDRLWSNLPYLRALATITHDTLDWYGYDEFGGGVHDVIGTRCDPYTNHNLNGVDYHYCCHSNLCRALSDHLAQPIEEIEHLVHDVMNVFMCTGFTLDTHEYFMKASPVRPGDYIEFLAETDLLGGLSACPGGNCGSDHSSDVTPCYPLHVEVFKATNGIKGWAEAQPSGYNRQHGRS